MVDFRDCVSEITTTGYNAITSTTDNSVDRKPCTHIRNLATFVTEAGRGIEQGNRSLKNSSTKTVLTEQSLFILNWTELDAVVSARCFDHGKVETQPSLNDRRHRVYCYSDWEKNPRVGCKARRKAGRTSAPTPQLRPVCVTRYIPTRESMLDGATTSRGRGGCHSVAAGLSDKRQAMWFIFDHCRCIEGSNEDSLAFIVSYQCVYDYVVYESIVNEWGYK